MFHIASLQNIVLSGGSTMFKDFGRRIERDVKRFVDVREGARQAQIKSSNPNSDFQMQQTEVKVCLFCLCVCLRL